jgi:hypothetical protein
MMTAKLLFRRLMVMARAFPARTGALGVGVGLAVIGVTWTVVAQSAGVPTYTGCYNSASGTINKLAIGDTPLKACVGETLVRFSAGDITKISVTGGLTGGGDNGDVTIGLDPKFSLPQACSIGAVSKWDGTQWVCAADDNTTYIPGIGLTLLGNQFNVASTYRLPQGCADGSIPKQQGGVWVCQALAATLTVQTATGPDAGIPDDGTFHSFASVGVGPGTYMVTAKGTIGSEQNVSAFALTGCEIRTDTATVEVSAFGLVTNEVSELPVALTGVATLAAPGTIRLGCTALPGADGMTFGAHRLVVLKVS